MHIMEQQHCEFRSRLYWRFLPIWASLVAVKIVSPVEKIAPVEE
jgi:hypothetical protein